MTFKYNKSSTFLILIIIFYFYMPHLYFADSITDGLITADKYFKFGPKIKTLIDTNLKPLGDVYNGNVHNAQANVGKLFISLMVIHMMYEISKCYMEGEYNRLPTMVCTLAFKYIAVGTFLGCYGSGNWYFFKIPSEIIKTATGTTTIDLEGGNPITTLGNLIESMFAPWDNNASKSIGKLWVDYNDSGVFSDGLMVIGYLVLAIIGTAILVIGYVMLTLASLGIILKAVELCIAIPVAVLLLSGKAIGIGEQYFSIAMKYIIAAIMDIAIVLLVCNISNKMLSTLPMSTIFELLQALLALIIFVVMLKVAPKIGSGLLSGRPGISMSDASHIMDVASQVGGITAGSINAIGGATTGARAAANSGGGVLAMAKGAYNGAGDGASRAKQSANDALK